MLLTNLTVESSYFYKEGATSLSDSKLTSKLTQITVLINTSESSFRKITIPGTTWRRVVGEREMRVVLPQGLTVEVGEAQMKTQTQPEVNRESRCHASPLANSSN